MKKSLLYSSIILTALLGASSIYAQKDERYFAEGKRLGQFLCLKAYKRRCSPLSQQDVKLFHLLHSATNRYYNMYNARGRVLKSIESYHSIIRRSNLYNYFRGIKEGIEGVNPPTISSHSLTRLKGQVDSTARVTKKYPIELINRNLSNVFSHLNEELKKAY